MSGKSDRKARKMYLSAVQKKIVDQYAVKIKKQARKIRINFLIVLGYSLISTSMIVYLLVVGL